MHHTVFVTRCSLVTDVNIDIAHCAESMVGKSEKNGGMAISPGNYQWFFEVHAIFFFYPVVLPW